MPALRPDGRSQGKPGRPRRQGDFSLTFAQRAKATLGHVRFSLGVHAGPVRLSPDLNRQQRQELEFWIRRMPAAFRSQLPLLKLAAADQLNMVRRSVFINDNPLPQTKLPREHTHAVSFIPERYVVLDAGLFRRRVELGRILYHELCHFIWPRLGNPGRRRFEALLHREFRERVRGELGYSSEYRKASHFAKSGVPNGRRVRWGAKSGVPKSRSPQRIPKRRGGDRRKGFWSAKKASPASPSARRRLWREYVCESFCDTGSFVLLGRERRKRHSEYTLSQAARKRRSRAWAQVVLESPAGPAERTGSPTAGVPNRGPQHILMCWGRSGRRVRW